MLKNGKMCIVKTFTAAIWVVVVVVIITLLNWTVTRSIMKTLSSKASPLKEVPKQNFASAAVTCG